MAAGPMKISFEDGTKPQHFLEQCTSNKIEFSHFRPFKIGTDIIEIEKTVTNIHIIESYAAVSHFAISQQIKNLVSKSLILITCRGRPDILLRLFVNSLKKNIRISFLHHNSIVTGLVFHSINISKMDL